MKLDALDHPKTFDFAARLNVELPTALGHLELLWAFTGKQAPQGNIGKWPDGAIARACYWMGQPEDFIRALREAGLIDADATHRLVIHDWHEHAPRWVKLKLSKLGLSFISGVSATTEPSIEGTEDDVEPSIEPSIEAATEGPSKGRVEKRREEKTGEGRHAQAREPSRSSRGKKPKIPLPEDFPLDEGMRVYAEQRLPQVDAGKLFESFCGKARAKSWVYADWRQAWQEFCRNCAPDSGHWAAGQYPKLKPHEPAMLFGGKPVEWQ